MQRKEIQRGDLFYYDFGKREGSVQSGERPVMVIQADNFNANAPTIIVAAVTAVMKKKYLPSHIILGEDFGLKKPSMVLLEQMMNQLSISEYNPRMKYCDKFKFVCALMVILSLGGV